MSKPSISTIDLWLFEYAEGNLSPHQIEELENFISKHPELELDKEMWQSTIVAKSEFLYPDQHKLKRKPVGFMYTLDTVLLMVIAATFAFSTDSTDSLAVTQLASKGKADASLVVKSDEQVLSDAGSDSDRKSTTNSNLNFEQNGFNLEKVQVTAFVNDEVNTKTTSVSKRNGSTEGSSAIIVSKNSGIEEVGTASKDAVSQESQLRTFKVKPVDIPNYKGRNTLNYGNSGSGIVQSDNYKVTMRSRVYKMGRTIQRMMDNPIALTNYKDPFYHVPGMLPNDVSFSSNGTLLTTRVQSLTRIQWLGQENEQLMNQIAIDGYAYGVRGGWGVQINHGIYNKGGVNNGSVTFSYSPKFSISNKVSFEPSLRFKMGNKMMNYNLMSGSEMVEVDRGNAKDFYKNGAIPLGNDIWYRDLGTGFLINTKWFFAGAQVDDILHHKDNLFNTDYTNPERARTHFVATAGTDWMSIKENMSLSPYAVYQNKGQLSELWLGANYRLNWLCVGAAISSNADLGASLGVKHERFAIMVNSDFTKSMMTGERALSHQLMFRYTGKKNVIGKRLINL